MKLFDGAVATSDIPNGNNRVFPKKVLESLVKNSQERIAQGTELGMFGMPTSSALPLSEVSHRVTQLEMIGDNLVCEIEVIDTLPGGKILLELAEKGEKLAIRLAGIGNLSEPDEHGIQIVQDDYKLISLNVVKNSDAA